MLYRLLLFERVLSLPVGILSSFAVRSAGLSRLVICLHYTDGMVSLTRSEQTQRLVKFAAQGKGMIWSRSFHPLPRVMFARERASYVGVDTADRQDYLGRQPASRDSGCRGSVAGTLSGPTGLFCGGMAKSSKHEDLKNVSGVQITRGQAQILDLAADDLGVKQIAKQLGVSVPTVKTQLQRFYKANGLHSRAGAVALWLGTRRSSSRTRRLSGIASNAEKFQEESSQTSI